MNAVTLEIDNFIAQVEMHAPPNNYFDLATLTAIADAASQALDQGARAIVLCSEGKHFCAGANFGGSQSGGDRTESARAIYAQANRIFRIALPVVAAVQGSAVGGGLGLACAADFRVVSKSAKLHANFSRLGFHQGFGLSVSLPRIIGLQRAQTLLYTSRPIFGDEAFEWGLADRVVDENEDVRDKALEFATHIAAAAPLAVRSIKETLRAELVTDVERVLVREVQEQAWLWGTQDSRAGITASLAREEPRFLGR
jgi:enoyl-CoA hydratase/carnithine racemase